MRRVLVVVVLLVAVVACSNVVLGGVGTTTTTSTIRSTTTSTTIVTTTSTTRPSPIGGYLVKYDLETLNPIPGLEPIPMGMNSWSIQSEDGEWMVILEYAGETLSEISAVDVTTWEVTSEFEGIRHSAHVVNRDTFYMYDHVSGAVSALDLHKGRLTDLGSWPAGFHMWGDLHVLPDGRLVGMGTNEIGGASPARYSALWLDHVSGESGEIEIGAIERVNPETGVFDGTYQIPEHDTPGVAWGESSLFIVHADGPEVTVVDLETGEVVIHELAATSWFDRLLAFWVLTATAKGPSLGTFSSAALSEDGRYLLISGNRYEVAEGSDGSLVEESRYLGLTVVDTQTWRVVAQPELPVQFVRESRGVIFGVDTRSTSPWIEDVYVVEVDETGTLSHQGPLSLMEGGGCITPVGDSQIVCSDYSGAHQNLSVVDLTSGEVLASTHIGREDWILDNGVVVDWAPSLETSLD
jgi:hypothetical protein